MLEFIGYALMLLIGFSIGGVFEITRGVQLRKIDGHKYLITDAVVENLCEVQHKAYEKAALEEGWETNPESRTAWTSVPDSNKRTMRKGVLALLHELDRQRVLR